MSQKILKTNKMIGEIIINLKCTEQELIESLLNQFYSGFSDRKMIIFTLSIVALGESWNVDKLEHYLEMFGEKRDLFCNEDGCYKLETKEVCEIK